jgi:S-(hydroxymethyl)glutathione dehydrogenase/alcohol dehydrogenase
MKALIYEGLHKISYTEDLDVREPDSDEVLVRIAASGICHSDLLVVDGTIEWPAPAVLGHEGAGVIERVGANVTDLKPGDHVALHTLANCGRCRYCAAGKPTRCRHTLGNRTQPFSLGGAPVSNFAATSTFAEFTIVKQQQAVKIDPSIPLDLACLIGCGVMTGVGAVIHRAEVQPGDTAVVIGVGGIGLNVIQGLRIAGASRIVAVDLLASREAMARDFGATDFIDASKEDSTTRIKEMFADPVNAGASGVDWAFECSGSGAALRGAVESLGWGGNCVVIGMQKPGSTVEIPIGPLAMVDRGVIGVRYGTSQPNRDIQTYLSLFQNGVLKLKELASQRYALKDYEQAFKDMESGKLARGVFVF